MTKNPFINALAAAGYIVGIVTFLQLGTKYFGGENQPDNFFIPMGMLSLLVFSVATMAYIFFYHPVVMLLDGKRTEAVRLFGRTVGSFGVITICLLTLAFLMLP